MMERGSCGGRDLLLVVCAIYLFIPITPQSVILRIPAIFPEHTIVCETVGQREEAMSEADMAFKRRNWYW